AMRRLVTPLDAEQVRAMTGGAVPVILLPDGSWEALDAELQAEALVTTWRGDEADCRLEALRHGARLVIRVTGRAVLDLDVQSSLVDELWHPSSRWQL
ncbi:hypothetical protein AB1L30_00385, partial [Bremerella sp. JC817]